MSRFSDWWKWFTAPPEPSVFDAGRASIQYPPLGRNELAAFHRCETHLLREIVAARSWGRQVEARGSQFPTNGWLIMPGRVYSALMDDTRGTGPRPPVMDAVVAWLADAGAVQPLLERTRDDIATSNVAERRADHAGYVPDDGTREWDHDTWQVDPDRMLEVYPHLVEANSDWKRAATR
ncbi:hypothetical protein [Curtobacterium sp. MCSS17_007]|uniref:hypothetical protein n=1 Tax=Curtobacterium sp. MCSS17_007 TaxID=2175646 RepID=UPI000DA9BB57|nr:hypothetical protein [Curtobacterium sp. MCSS17_007]WIE77082.1 hypothetical protein DEJ22_007470 [Curtobacterium sp. MCSS17_007]